MISFLSSLIWPLVDSYWVTIVFLFSMRANQAMTFTKLIVQVIFLLFSLFIVLRFNGSQSLYMKKES